MVENMPGTVQALMFTYVRAFMGLTLGPFHTFKGDETCGFGFNWKLAKMQSFDDWQRGISPNKLHRADPKTELC